MQNAPWSAGIAANPPPCASPLALTPTPVLLCVFGATRVSRPCTGVMRKLTGHGIRDPLPFAQWDTGLTVASDDNGVLAAGYDLPKAKSRVAGVVESALETLLPPVEGAEARLAEAMRYAALGGGKRLRAFLVLESAALFAVSETCAARVAASIEMLHAY